MDNLRHLRNKNNILTSDVLCALDDLDLTQSNVVIMARHLVTLFMLINCSVLDNLDFHQVIDKVRSTTTYTVNKINIISPAQSPVNIKNSVAQKYSFRFVSYRTIPYNAIHTISYHTIPYHTIPYHTKPYHTIPYHTTS